MFSPAPFLPNPFEKSWVWHSGWMFVGYMNLIYMCNVETAIRATVNVPHPGGSQQVDYGCMGRMLFLLSALQPQAFNVEIRQSQNSECSCWCQFHTSPSYSWTMHCNVDHAYSWYILGVWRKKASENVSLNYGAPRGLLEQVVQPGQV